MTFYEKVARASRPGTGRDGLVTFSCFALTSLFKDVHFYDNQSQVVIKNRFFCKRND